MDDSTRRGFVRNVLLAGGAAMLPAPYVFTSTKQPQTCHLNAQIAAPKFYWGVGIENGWIAQTDPIKDGKRRRLDVYEQMQHYEKWKEDLNLAAELGVNAIRYSVPWYKAEPKPGVYDWSWIDKPVEYLVNKLNIIPVLDIIHYGTPVWMADGLADDRFVGSITAYSAAMASHFKGLVNHYTPQNEPQVNALFCGLIGRWPPYSKNFEAWSKLGVRLAKATVEQTRAIRSAAPDARIISAEPFLFTAIGQLLPELKRENPADSEMMTAAAIFPSCLSYGKVPAKHPMAAFLEKQGVPTSDIEWFSKNFATPDIFGINYYPEIEVPALGGDYTRKGTIPLATAVKEAVAYAEEALRIGYSYYKAPIYFTETSAGLNTEAKVAYMDALYDVILKLRREGVPIRGLNWWPLFNTILWNYREEVDKPLEAFIKPGEWNNGLYVTEPASGGDLKRIETAAAKEYSTLIKRDERYWSNNAAIDTAGV